MSAFSQIDAVLGPPQPMGGATSLADLDAIFGPPGSPVATPPAPINPAAPENYDRGGAMLSTPEQYAAENARIQGDTARKVRGLERDQETEGFASAVPGLAGNFAPWKPQPQPAAAPQPQPAKLTEEQARQRLLTMDTASPEARELRLAAERAGDFDSAWKADPLWTQSLEKARSGDSELLDLYGRGGVPWFMKRVPFGRFGVEIAENKDIQNTIGRLQSMPPDWDDGRNYRDQTHGKFARAVDMRKLAAFIATQEKQAAESGVGGAALGALDFATEMPAYITEFVMTGPAFESANVGAQAAGKALLGQAAERGAGRLAVKAAGGVAGTVAQSAANPLMVAASGERMKTRDVLAGKQPGEYGLKGFLDTFIELGSERVGAEVLGTFKGAWMRATGKTAKDFAAAAATKPGRSAIGRVLSAAAISRNPIEETSEEVVGQLARYATGLEDQPLPSGKEFAAMGVGFGGLGLLGLGGGRMQRGPIAETERFLTAVRIPAAEKTARRLELEKMAAEAGAPTRIYKDYDPAMAEALMQIAEDQAELERTGPVGFRGPSEQRTRNTEGAIEQIGREAESAARSRTAAKKATRSRELSEDWAKEWTSQNPQRAGELATASEVSRQTFEELGLTSGRNRRERSQFRGMVRRQLAETERLGQPEQAPQPSFVAPPRNVSRSTRLGQGDLVRTEDGQLGMVLSTAAGDRFWIHSRRTDGPVLVSRKQITEFHRTPQSENGPATKPPPSPPSAPPPAAEPARPKPPAPQPAPVLAPQTEAAAAGPAVQPERVAEPVQPAARESVQPPPPGPQPAAEVTLPPPFDALNDDELRGMMKTLGFKGAMPQNPRRLRQRVAKHLEEMGMHKALHADAEERAKAPPEEKQEEPPPSRPDQSQPSTKLEGEEFGEGGPPDLQHPPDLVILPDGRLGSVLGRTGMGWGNSLRVLTEDGQEHKYKPEELKTWTQKSQSKPPPEQQPEATPKPQRVDLFHPPELVIQPDGSVGKSMGPAKGKYKHRLRVLGENGRTRSFHTYDLRPAPEGAVVGDKLAALPKPEPTIDLLEQVDDQLDDTGSSVSDETQLEPGEPGFADVQAEVFDEILQKHKARELAKKQLRALLKMDARKAREREDVDAANKDTIPGSELFEAGTVYVGGQEYNFITYTDTENGDSNDLAVDEALALIREGVLPPPKITDREVVQEARDRWNSYQRNPPPAPDAGDVPFRVGPKKLTRPPKAVTTDQVQRAFPGARVEPIDGGWRVNLSDRSFTVESTGQVELSDAEWRGVAKAYNIEDTPVNRRRLTQAGAYRLTLADGTRVDGLGLIQLVEGLADDKTLRHEALHLARAAGMFSNAEWQALVDRYSDRSKPWDQQEEDIAKARERFSEPDSLWRQVKDFLQKILSALGISKLDGRQVFRTMDRAGFWQREAKDPADRQVLAQRGVLAQMVRRPRPLAKGSSDPAVRQQEQKADQERWPGNKYERRARAVAEEEAAARLLVDYEGEKARLQQQLDRGGALESEADTRMVDMITAREVKQALKTGDAEALARARQWRIAHTEARQEAARLLGRPDPARDFSLPPEERREHQLAREATKAGEKSEALEQAASDGLRKLTRQLDAADGGQQAEMLQRKIERQRQILERLRNRSRAELKQIHDALRKAGFDVIDLAEIAKSPKRTQQFLRVVQSKQAGFADKAFEFWRNSILSAITTTGADVLSSAGYTAWRSLGQRAFEVMTGTARREADRAYAGEFGYVFRGMLPGVFTGIRTAIKAARTESPSFEVSMGRESSERIEGRRSAIGGTKGRVIRMMGYTRLLMADEFFKTLNYHMEVSAQAYRLGKAQGLNGEALDRFIAGEVANPLSEASERAIGQAREVTFQDPGGRERQLVHRGVAHLRQIRTIRWLLPFAFTPVNIAATGIRMSPFGVFNLAHKWHQAHQTGDFSEVNVRLAEQLIAWGVVAFLFGFNDPDHPLITGAAGQGIYGQRLQEKRTFQPQSIRIPWTDAWVSYSRIEPFATAIAATVDGVNGLRKKERALPAVVNAVSGQVKDKTYLKGVADLLSWFDEAEGGRGAERWAANFVASWVPNIARHAARSMQENEPNRRDPNASFLKQVTLKTEVLAPLFDEQPAYDCWGRPYPRSHAIPQTDYLMRLAVPAQVKIERTFVGDRVLMRYNTEHPDDDWLPTEPSNKYQRDGTTHTMTREQYADFVRLSGQVAARLVASDRFDEEHPTTADRDAIRDYMTQARGEVRDWLVSKWQGKEVDERIPEQIAGDIHRAMVLGKAKSLARMRPSFGSVQPQAGETKGQAVARERAEWQAERDSARRWLQDRGITLAEVNRVYGRYSRGRKDQKIARGSRLRVSAAYSGS